MQIVFSLIKVRVKYYLLNKFPLEVSYNEANIKDADNNPLYIGFKGGYTWFLRSNISVESGICYYAPLNEDYGNGKVAFQFNIGLALHF